MNEDPKIKRIFEAVEAVTGINRDAIISGLRVRECCYARVIAAYHLKANGYANDVICSLIGVLHTRALQYQIRRYLTDPTPYFRKCAVEVKRILSE